MADRLRPCAEKRGTEGASAASGTGSSALLTEKEAEVAPLTEVEGADVVAHSLMGEVRAGTVLYFAPGCGRALSFAMRTES